MSIQTTSPATNKVLKSFDEMTDQQVDQAVAQSAKTYQEWKKTSYPERAALLHKVASLMREKKNSLSDINYTRNGKNIFSSRRGDRTKC